MYTWSTLMMQSGLSDSIMLDLNLWAQTQQLKFTQFQRSSLRFRLYPQHDSDFTGWIQCQLEDGRNSKQTLQRTRSRHLLLLEMGSCGLHVLHGVYKTAQSVTSWKLDKFLKNCFFILKKSPAWRSAYLKRNDLFVSNEGKDTSYLFPLKYFWHSWLENGKAIGRIIEILWYIKQYLKELKDKKAFPENDDWFVWVCQMVNSHVPLPILEFSKSIMNVMELFLTLFQAEHPPILFLHEHLMFNRGWSFPWWIALFVL